MTTWHFHPFLPTKEAYETRPFQRAKNIYDLIGLLEQTSFYLRGQLQVKGTKTDYPEEFTGKQNYESEDKQLYTIQYNSTKELKYFLKKIEYKEEKIERINLFGKGFFLKMRG